jgi:hypothetical protein
MFFAATLLVLLAACQSTPRLEDDARYVKLARVVDVHEFTELERKQAAGNRPTLAWVSVWALESAPAAASAGSCWAWAAESASDATVVMNRRRSPGVQTATPCSP